jgi:hypothetical protein
LRLATVDAQNDVKDQDRSQRCGTSMYGGPSLSSRGLGENAAAFHLTRTRQHISVLSVIESDAPLDFDLLAGDNIASGCSACRPRALPRYLKAGHQPNLLTTLVKEAPMPITAIMRRPPGRVTGVKDSQHRLTMSE